MPDVRGSPSSPGKAGIAAILALATGLVAHWEGYSLTAYADPVKINTICYGHTDPSIRKGDTATKAECERLLTGDLAEAYAAVGRCVTVPLKPNEAAALTSFAFNVGGGTLCKSTLARLANKGVPASVWCYQLDRFVYARGIKFNGLVKRRAAERQMCLGVTA